VTEPAQSPHSKPEAGVRGKQTRLPHFGIAAWEWVCLAVFLGLTGCQLFVRPLTGLSDNNDFPKVLGPAHICHAPVENLNTYFVSGYAAGPTCAWPSGFISSEILFLDLARYLSRPLTGRLHFDIRASAALHLLVLATAMVLFLQITRRQAPLVRFMLPSLAIVMFSDVTYVAYLNSAYMDNASWVLFLLLSSVAAQGCIRAEARWIAPVYGIAAVLLEFSKAQHAGLGILFAALAVFFAWQHGVPRAAWLLVAGVLAVTAVVVPSLTPPEYQRISLYNVVFSRLAPANPTVFAELGLDPKDEKWKGTSAFVPDSPLNDPAWTSAFVARVSFGGIARLYVRHPGIAFREIDRELHDSVHSMRPIYLANYREADGFPPHTMATRFSFWSNLRIRMMWTFPHHLLLLYAAPLLAGAVFALRRAPFFPLVLTLAVAGISEFVLCTLADGIDTHRHLFLFHVITETLLLLIVGWILSVPAHGRTPL
jgi:hypothetical protein